MLTFIIDVIIISNIFIETNMSSPSQLFSCVESDAILRSPINNSSAKTNWSFTKDSRFKRPQY